MENNKDTICGQIRKVSNLIKRQMNSELAVYDITGTQLYILNYIIEKKQIGAVFQKDVKQYFGVSRSTITGNLQRLESKGLIQRRRIDDDARMIEVEPTKKAFEIINHAEHIKRSVEKNIQMNLSKEEINSFIIISRKIIERLENREQEG